MKIETIIYSNGEKWAGEQPNNIDKLIDILKTETIEERFFTQYSVHISETIVENRNHCPISENNGITTFFGNFERLSHVFRIETNDKKVIKRLSEAIKENEGWKKYYVKHLIKNNLNQQNKKLCADI